MTSRMLGIGFLTPAIVAVVIFFLLPVLLTVVFAFTNMSTSTGIISPLRGPFSIMRVGKVFLPNPPTFAIGPSPNTIAAR